MTGFALRLVAFMFGLGVWLPGFAADDLLTGDLTVIVPAITLSVCRANEELVARIPVEVYTVSHPLCARRDAIRPADSR